MKLFIERLTNIGSCIKDIVLALKSTLIGVIIFWASYFISVISPTTGYVILAISSVTLSILLIIPICAFVHWLFIEPFFTKKGVDRK